MHERVSFYLSSTVFCSNLKMWYMMMVFKKDIWRLIPMMLSMMMVIMTMRSSKRTCDDDGDDDEKEEHKDLR